MALNQISVSRINFRRFYGDSGTHAVASLSQNGARLNASQAPPLTVVSSTDMFGNPIVVQVSSVVENSIKSGDLSKTLFNVEIIRCTPDFMKMALDVRRTVATENESATQYNSAKSQGHIPARATPAPTVPEAVPNAVINNLQAQAESFI